jgi:quercetin dioxygenase-like cupin family protein
MVGSKEVRVLGAGEECAALPLVEGEGIARAVIWPGIGAQLRSMHRISLAPGARTIPQRHPMEAVYYVLSGEGIVRDPEHPPEQPLVEGSMVHVEPGTAYVLEAGPQGIEILGGPCPADAALYAGLSA